MLKWLLVLVVGVVVIMLATPWLSRHGLGRLPGDVTFQWRGRRVYLPRGRMLGGSSSMNAMIYMRGNRLDFQEWAALGLEGWGWEDVLPYFLKAEDNERGASEWHGVGGPLPVSEHLKRQTHEKEDREHFRQTATMRADSNGDGQRPENRA